MMNAKFKKVIEMSVLDKWKKITDFFKFADLTFGEAKVLTLLYMIDSDDKKEISREMRLLEALVKLDMRLNFISITEQKKRFAQLQRDDVLRFLKELEMDYEEQLNLIASAYLIAGIDNYVSDGEKHFILKIADALGVSQKDTDLILSNTQYIISMLNEWFFFEQSQATTDDEQNLAAQTTILTILLVIHLDDEEVIPEKMRLMEAFCIFEPYLAKQDIGSLFEKFETLRHDSSALLENIPNHIQNNSQRKTLLSICLLIADIDGKISTEELKFFRELAELLNLPISYIEDLREKSHRFICVMEEMQILSFLRPPQGSELYID